MPRVLNPTKMAYAAELYAAGKTFKQVASELGMDTSSLRSAMIRRGVKPRPRAYRSPGVLSAAPDGCVAGYLSGISENVLAARYGVSRAVVARWLRESGVDRRGIQQAATLRRGYIPAAERSANARAAHDARRGQTNTEAHQCCIANTRERICWGGSTSRGTDYLAAALAERGIPLVREKAVGRYNVDLAITAEAVAVEVLGGNWHGSKPIHAKRTPYILNRGWSMLFVWDQQLAPLGSAALSYLVAYLEEAGRNPAPVCEYRVIRGDGKLVAVGHADDDDFPLVLPSVAKLD